MARPDPIQYAERLYGAIRAANFSPISFLTFGNAIKDGVSMRNMPRVAAEPFMRIVGEMLDLEDETAAEEIIEAELSSGPVNGAPPAPMPSPEQPVVESEISPDSDRPEELVAGTPSEKRRKKR